MRETWRKRRDGRADGVADLLPRVLPRALGERELLRRRWMMRRGKCSSVGPVSTSRHLRERFRRVRRQRFTVP